MSGERPTIRIAYRFAFKDEGARDFAITLDHETLQVVHAPRASYPEWTALAYKKCPNCPLDEAQNPRCPIAPDWELSRLLGLLEECRQTNAAFVRRLQSLGINDATPNALAMLNTMGEITSLSIEGDLRRLEKIFSDHYGRPGGVES